MILLYTFKLCIKATFIGIVVVVDNNCFVRTPNKSWKIHKFYLKKINYFSMSYVSTYNVIADSVAQFADINTTNKIYINSWLFVEYL